MTSLSTRFFGQPSDRKWTAAFADVDAVEGRMFGGAG
jgi:hypothetical protein